jgi:hypothetical protein
MTTQQLEFEPSEDQLDLIEDHLFLGVKLGVAADENVFLYQQLHKKFSTAKITAAHLDLEKLKWIVTFEI